MESYWVVAGWMDERAEEETRKFESSRKTSRECREG